MWKLINKRPILNGQRENEMIRVYEMEDGQFLLKNFSLQSWPSKTIYYVGGEKEVEVVGKSLICPQWKGCFVGRWSTNETVGYKYKSNGSTISVEKYNEKYKRLHFNKTNDDGYFGDVDDEYKYKKFAQSIEAVIEKKDHQITVSNDEFVFCGYVNKNEKFIEPVINMDKRFDNGWFDFNRDLAMKTFFLELCKEYDLESDLGSHNNCGLEFAKADGDYFTISFHCDPSLHPKNFKGFKNRFQTFHGPFSSCIQERDDLFKYIKSGFQYYANKKNGVVDYEQLIKLLGQVKLNKMTLEELEKRLKYTPV